MFQLCPDGLDTGIKTHLENIFRILSKLLQDSIQRTTIRRILCCRKLLDKVSKWFNDENDSAAWRLQASKKLYFYSWKDFFKWIFMPFYVIWMLTSDFSIQPIDLQTYVIRHIFLRYFVFFWRKVPLWTLGRCKWEYSHFFQASLFLYAQVMWRTL